jgi:putative chitinase
MNLSAEVISQATGSTLANAEKFRPYLNRYMRKYEINTPQRVMAFLSQIGHESARLSTTQEFASGSAYEGRSDLGNTNAGDGVKFKGRGLIQVTGRFNYQNVKEYFGWDVVNNPQILEEPEKATEVSAWWWSNRIRGGKNLNQWSDNLDPTKSVYDGNNNYVFTEITKAINGGTNGLSDRQNLFEKARSQYDKIKKMIGSFATFWWLIPIALFGTTMAILYFRQKNKN